MTDGAKRAAVGVKYGVWAVKAPDGTLETTPVAVVGTVVLIGLQVSAPVVGILGGLAVLGHYAG